MQDVQIKCFVSHRKGEAIEHSFSLAHTVVQFQERFDWEVLETILLQINMGGDISDTRLHASCCWWYFRGRQLSSFRNVCGSRRYEKTSFFVAASVYAM